MAPERTVFISYRRKTSKYFARMIFHHLRERGFDVFLDAETIREGQFKDIILREIAARTHFIMVVSEGGFDQCDYPDDWLRLEFEEAYRLQRNIVPVVEEGVDLGALKGKLKGTMRHLVNYNALRVPFDYFDAAMDRLSNEFLQKPVEVALIRGDKAHRAAVVQMIAETERLGRPAQGELEAEKLVRKAVRTMNRERKREWFDEAIRLHPGSAYAHNDRGMMRYYTGDVDGALADVTRAVQLDPKTAMHLNNLGLIHLEKGEIEAALSELSQAIELDPGLGYAYSNRAKAYQMQGDDERAAADSARAKELFAPPTAYLLAELPQRRRNRVMAMMVCVIILFVIWGYFEGDLSILILYSLFPAWFLLVAISSIVKERHLAGVGPIGGGRE